MQEQKDLGPLLHSSQDNLKVSSVSELSTGVQLRATVVKILQLTSLCAKTCFPHTLRDVPKNTPTPNKFGARSDDRNLTLK